MKILHVITRLILGGAQQNTVMNAVAQVRAGHDVMLAYGPIHGPEGSLLDEARQSGATLFEIPTMVRAVDPWKDWQCYRALRCLIREHKPDVVHTHSSKAGILGRSAAWREHVPAVIHTVHGLPFYDGQSRWQHGLYVHLERWASRRCHHLIGITPAMRDAFVAQRIAKPDQFTIIPSGVDLSRFERDRPTRQGPLVVAILARLDALKGHDDLLDIFPQLLGRFPDLELWFIGDGWHRSHLEQRIAAMPCADQIKLTGLVDHDRIASVLTQVDVKVLPSYQEGQSRTLIEALLCGCGIVAYDVGGIPWVCIHNVTGKLVPVGDTQALADAILWMLEHFDERQRLVKAGQAHVREHFDVRHMDQQIENVYTQVLQSQR